MNGENFQILILYMLITHLKIKILEKNNERTAQIMFLPKICIIGQIAIKTNRTLTLLKQVNKNVPCRMYLWKMETTNACIRRPL